MINKKAYIGTPSYTNAEVFVTGFDPNAEKRDPEEKIGRNMIGIPYDGSDIAYIFITGDDRGYGARQQEAIKVLKSDFGCKKIVMLDGSASAQFYWNGSKKVDSKDKGVWTRSVPVVLRMDRRWKSSCFNHDYSFL